MHEQKRLVHLLDFVRPVELRGGDATPWTKGASSAALITTAAPKLCPTMTTPDADPLRNGTPERVEHALLEVVGLAVFDAQHRHSASLSNAGRRA
jgi:hypothetical protein